MNNTGIKLTKYMSDKQILFSVQPQQSVPVVVDETAGVLDNATKRKIVKAGTPLTGSLDDRNTAFTKAGTGNAKGVLLHDVDVTTGDGNGTLLIFGFVNKNRIDETTLALITADVESTLGMIKFLKD